MSPNKYFISCFFIIFALNIELESKMSELDRLVSQIENKSIQLVKRRRELKEENSQLKARISELEAEIEQQKQTINELKEKHQVLKIAKTIGNEEDNREAIKQLDLYIKEIDRCIALLNS